MREAQLKIDLWDVGQGDCSVIHLPDGRLLIIDVGPRGSPLVDWLNDRRSKRPEIAAIVLTHNDADHAGALPSIIIEHKDRIKLIWMLMDREVTSDKFQKIFRAAEAAEIEGCFPIKQIKSEEVLWCSDDAKSMLRIIHPNFSENVRAILSGSPNSSSGMIVFEHDGKRLFTWPGDLEIRTVAEKHEGSQPWMLFGPHHGGPSDYPTKSVRRRAGINSGRLKNEVRVAVDKISPERVFISVGSKNQHHHPRPGYIKLLAQHGTRVTCSQLTLCCERKMVRSGAHVFQGSGALGLRACRTGVSCRGSFRLYFKDGELLPDEFDAAHRAEVEKLLRPQCLCTQADQLQTTYKAAV